jgi:hypothetical protein
VIGLLRALVVLVVIALAIAAFAPASLVAQRVAAATGGTLRLADARGTVWNGTADVVLANGRWVSPVSWTLQPLPLVKGEAHVAVRPASGAPGVRADIVAREHVVDVADVDVLVPAGALPLPPGVSAGGEVHVVADHVRLAPGTHEGTARVEWSRARVALPGATVVDLGTAAGTLSADGTRWRGPLQARGGMLQVDGDAAIDTDGAELSVALVPQPGAPAMLRQWLGPADAQGVTRLKLAPRFR